jgi:hypothetical protein
MWLAVAVVGCVCNTSVDRAKLAPAARLAVSAMNAAAMGRGFGLGGKGLLSFGMGA